MNKMIFHNLKISNLFIEFYTHNTTIYFYKKYLILQRKLHIIICIMYTYEYMIYVHIIIQFGIRKI